MVVEIIVGGPGNNCDLLILVGPPACYFSILNGADWDLWVGLINIIIYISSRLFLARNKF